MTTLEHRLQQQIERMARFYRMAKRSAIELAAIMHICDRLQLEDRRQPESVPPG